MPLVSLEKLKLRRKLSPLELMVSVAGGRRGRICRVCKEWTILNKLNPSKKSKCGRSTLCNSCYRDEKFFGGNKHKTLKRDKNRCVKCGMKQNKHIIKWGTMLTVDHKDGNGCSSKKKNNKMNNLQTLCKICHGKKDYKHKNIKDFEWSYMYKKCILCGTNKTEHQAKGKCARCYLKLWHKTHGKTPRPRLREKEGRYIKDIKPGRSYDCASFRHHECSGRVDHDKCDCKCHAKGEL